MQVNLLPFVVEAMGNNKRIYKDIDRLYQTNKYAFYKAAKEHELYTHNIIKGGSLIQEEYCKKILGILVYDNNNAKTMTALNQLYKKGFRYSYTYIENHLKITLPKFTQSFIKKHNGAIDKNGVHLEYHVIILIFLALNSGRELIYDDFYNEYMQNLNIRWEHYNDTETTRISLNKASKEDKTKIKNLKQAIYKEYGAIRNFDDLLDGHLHEQKMEQAAFLFDYEELSSISIFEDVKFTDKDIDEILYLYVIAKEDLDDTEQATKFLISHMYIKYMIKAYKQVKEMYFANNQETMFIELEGLEKSLHSTEQKLFLSKQALSELQKSHEDLEKENIRLKAELAEEKRNREELNSLREFIFNLDKKEEFIGKTINPEELKDFKAIIIGGHERWQQRMKELLPNFIFIHPDNLNFDTRILDDVDFVFIFPNYLNHGIYYKVMNAIEGKDIRIAYLNQQNEDLVLRNIYKKLGL